MILHSSQEDLYLNAAGDIDGIRFSHVDIIYLLDTSGNNLTDPSGNRLITYVSSTGISKLLHSVQDDFNLNAEKT
jgi:hypothetical protein